MQSEKLENFEFKVVSPDMVDAAYDFMWENFFPDEPMCRSVGMRRGTLLDGLVKMILKAGHSVAAIRDDGKMIGLRAGHIASPNDWMDKMLETNWARKILVSFMSWSKTMDKPAALIQAEDAIGYSVYKFIDETGASKVYKGLCVCTSQEARGKRLGTKLIEESLRMAKEAKCEYMYLLATGNYSNRIFDKFEFETKGVLVYSEFVDNATGEPILKDTREHIKAQVRFKKL